MTAFPAPFLNIIKKVVDLEKAVKYIRARHNDLIDTIQIVVCHTDTGMIRPIATDLIANVEVSRTPIESDQPATLGATVGPRHEKEQALIAQPVAALVSAHKGTVKLGGVFIHKIETL